MKNLSAVAVTICVIALTARESLAQSTLPTPVADNLAPVLVYQSPFADFVPLTEPTVSPAATWREVNKTVGSYDSMSATMGDMSEMEIPAGHDMKSMGESKDNKVPPKSDGMKSMPMKHDMPMGHDMKNMSKDGDMKSMPMKHDMPMGHDMKNMSKDGDMKSMPMKPAMKSMPMKKDMPMNMDDMPGMKGMK